MSESVDNLTPTEALIMELLQARYRLGENSWSFMNCHMKALNRLEERGFIQHKSAVVAGARLVWLTDLGYERLFLGKYNDQLDSKKVRERQKELKKKAKLAHRLRNGSGVNE